MASARPAHFPSLWGPFQVCQLQEVSLSPSCSPALLVVWQGLCTCLSFRFLYFLFCDPLRRQNLPYSKLSFFSFFILLLLFLLLLLLLLLFCLLWRGLVPWLESGDPFVSQNLREFYSFHSPFSWPCPGFFRMRFRQFVTWNIHTVVFSSRFCFLLFVVVLFVFTLSVLLLVAVISPSLLFLMWSSYWCITLSLMLVTLLPIYKNNNNLHTVVWFQTFLSKTNNLQTDLFYSYMGS